jgi:hypothetical protein
MLVEIDIIDNSGCHAEREPFCHGDVIYKRNNFCERYEKFKIGAIQRKDALRKMSINVGVFTSKISESGVDRCDVILDEFTLTAERVENRIMFMESGLMQF